MKKKINLFHFLLLLSAAMSFWGCPSKPKDIDNIIPLPEEFMHYISFKEGSWWMYQERFSGKRDSFWVSERRISTDFDYTFSPPPQFQDIAIDIKGKQFSGKDTFIQYYCIYSKGWGKSSLHLSHILKEYINRNANTSEHRLYYPFSSDTLYIRDSFDSTTLYPKIDTFSVKGIQYNEVQIAQYSTAKSIQHDPIFRCIWAKNVGVIRKEMRNGEIWELEKYEVSH